MTILRSRPSLTSTLVALTTGFALVLTGCSSDGGDDSSEQAWSYTDDLGVTVTLDHAPTRVAGLTDLLAPLMAYGVEPIASFGMFSIAEDGRFGDFDTSGITEVGTSYGEIDLDALALAKPDLIVDTIYPTDEQGTLEDGDLRYGLKDVAQQEQLQKIAPIVTVYVGGDGTTVLEKTAALAVALGADQAAIDADKQKYDQDAETLKAAAADSKIKVTVMYGDADGLYVVKVNDEPELRSLRDLGVDFFDPTPEGYYWGIYSWENATEVSGDMILLSKDGYQQDELKAQKTLATNAALTAGQVHTWGQNPNDYASQGQYMVDLAGWLKDSQVLTPAT